MTHPKQSITSCQKKEKATHNYVENQRIRQTNIRYEKVKLEKEGMETKIRICFFLLSPSYLKW